MSKARLRLILCSDDIETEARVRGRERRFHLSVIDGGRRAIATDRTSPSANPWDSLRDLFDLAILVSQTNYLAFVAASLTVLELHGWPDPRQAN